MPKRTSSYRERLLEDLRDPQEAANYINAAIDDSPEMLLVALRNVAEAHSMAKVARGAGVAREAVYRMLSAKGNPRWRSLRGVFHTLGLDFEVRPLEAEQRRGISKSSLRTSRGKRAAAKGLKVATVKQLAFTFDETMPLVAVFPVPISNVEHLPEAMNTPDDETIRTPAYMIPHNENKVVYETH